MAAIAIAIMTAYFAAYKSIDLARAKMVAVSLVNEKMETVRNMPYDDLGTSGGWPAGGILAKEEIEKNGVHFDIYTTISYIDDKYDGVAVPSAYPGETLTTDTSPYDYKEAVIYVTRHDKSGKIAKLTTLISAKAAETPSNSGILYLCIIDSVGNPVADADITISNDLLDPPFAPITNLKTGENGCVLVPMLPPEEHNNYHITATKNGFSSDLTYPRTAQNPNALQPDINILTQKVTDLTLTIDQRSTMNVHFADAAGNPVPDISFNIEGSKVAYFNPEVFKCSLGIAAIIPTSPCLTTYQADAAGFISIPNLEFDDYKIINLTAGYYLISTTPMRAIPLPANITLEVTAVLSASATNPSIYDFSPVSGAVGDVISISLTGGNIDNGATIKLVNPGTSAEIAGTNIDVSPHDQIVADFNLAGAATGLWNLVLANPSGESVTQINGFEIIN